MRICLVLVVLLLWSQPAQASTRGELADYTTRAEGSWARVTGADGRVADPLEPAYGGFNYGTLLLAEAQLRGAQRSGDTTAVAAAVRQVRGLSMVQVQPNAFWGLGLSSLQQGMDQDEVAGQQVQLAPAVRYLSANVRDPQDPCHQTPACYNNHRLAWALGSAGLLDSGASGTPGSTLASPAAVRAEVDRVVNDLMVRNAGPLVRVDRLGLARSLSDPEGQPRAYHVFSTYLLQRLTDEHPQLVGPKARRVLDQASLYALTMMGPDGELTVTGRSASQSWVLAAAAALGSRRARLGGPRAGQWAAFSDRAARRLLQSHPALADGTLPVVPGLRTRFDADVMDSYASMTQFNGLTLWLLEDALARWPAQQPEPLPADGALRVSDLQGSGLVWGRSGGVWWAISGRRTGADPRLDQGLVSVKHQRPDGSWRDALAGRPLSGRMPRSGWVLRTASGRRGSLRMTRTAPLPNGVLLYGSWRDTAGRVIREARWRVQVRDGHLTITTEPLRAGERVTLTLWRVAGETGCLTTASGRACPMTIVRRTPGPLRLRL